MIEFPYGIADFHSIRTQGMLYVDRTGHVRDVESLGRALVFLRPRRFGKSLWLQTLANYYDLRRRDEFEVLFGGLDAGRQPTPLANRYFVLQWNFSEKGARGGVDEIGRQLNDYLNNKIKDFLVSYSAHLPGTVAIEPDAKDTLRHLLTAIRETPYKLYLLIDEYDNFISEVMVHDPDTYRALVRTDGPFKELFKSVKAAMEGQGLDRVFGAREAAMAFHQTGDLGPLASFFEERILPVLSNRDRGRAPRKEGQSGSGATETAVKSLFLSVLFDDTRFVTFSEMELSKGYADLCLLVRPEMRRYGFFDVLFEFKMVRLKELGRTGRDLAEMDEEALGRLPPVAKAFASARDQVERYGEALARRFGDALKLRSYTVVAVGLERLLVERISRP